MLRTILFLLALLCTPFIHAQQSETAGLVELGKAYHNFMFQAEPSKATLDDVRAAVPASLKGVTAFIIQTITTNNALLSKAFLTLPDSQTLRAIYIAERVNQNLHDDEPKDSRAVADSVSKLHFPRPILVENYYEMLFTAVGNKNKPRGLADFDFKMRDYGLTDEADRAIFFLQCARALNSEVWGFMNVVKPPNTKTAYAAIKRFPRFNGQPYYQYRDFNFPDFNTVVDKETGPESYKRYYLNKFYELLIYHVACLQKEGASEKEILDLTLGSIIKDRKYYKYTAYSADLDEFFGEGPLQFDKNFIDCENKWIALRPDSTGAHSFGFVYIDEQGGLTIQLGGDFRIAADNRFVMGRMDTTYSVKARLEPSNNRRVAIIPDNRLEELGLPATPEWLLTYLSDTGTAKSLYRRGYLYNAGGRPEKAVSFLLRALAKEPDCKGVAPELGYSYNALQQYDKALAVLTPATQDKLTDPCYYYKELNFAQLHLGMMDAAEKTAREALSACKQKVYQAELAYNVAAEFYKKRDAVNFKKWSTEAQKWTEPGDQFRKGLAAMEEELK